MIILIISGLSVITLFVLYKYLMLNRKVSKTIKNIESPIRKGYYEISLEQGTQKTQIDIHVFVKEIDRYTNGNSRLKLDNIEIHCGNNLYDKKSILIYVRKTFVSLKKTSDIEWLESENAIKEARKNKLSHLKNVMKNEKKVFRF